MGSLFWLILPGRWRWLGLLGLWQAYWLPGWGAFRLLWVQLAAWRQRGAALEVRALVALALLLDRCHAAEWSGQDFPMALLLLGGLALRWKSWRRLLTCLGLMWLVQGLSDWYGWWGWARPLPHPQETGSWAWCVSAPALGLGALLGAALGRRGIAMVLLGLALAPWPGPVASRAETRRWLDGRAADQPEMKFFEWSGERDWLLLSNNPERARGSLGGTLLQATTPAGRGRVLLSHINLGAPADLVVSGIPKEKAEVRVVQARDGSLTDPGSRLLQQTGDWQSLQPDQPWEHRLPGLLLNGMVQVEVRSQGEIDWRVSWNGKGAQLPLREGQSRGLFLRPDRVVWLLKAQGAWHWQGPWLANQQNQALLGNYGVCQTLVFDADQPGELWLVARGGVLGSVDGQAGPLLAAGQSRCLLKFARGPQRLQVWLPVNSFAPYSLVFRYR